MFSRPAPPPSTSPWQPRQPRRATLAAALSSTIGFLPVFLVAAQAAFVRSDLRFDEAQLGIAVSTFFATGAILSAPGGRVSERVGPYTGMLTAAAATSVVCLAIAALAWSLPVLVALLALAGAVNAVTQTSGDLAVARGVPQRLHGFAAGVKTSCLPLATLFAGAAIPAIGVRFGWRSSFAVVVGLALLLIAVVPKRHSFVGAPTHRTSLRPDVPTATLVLLAVAGALSIGAVNTMGAFYVESAMRHDLSPSQAGWWLAAGSLAAVTARVAFGAKGDRIADGHLRIVALLWVAGAVGVMLLAPTGSLALLAVGTLIAFAAGSGWTGLFLKAIVRSNPSAPASATGAVMSGEMAGSVLGPLAFGAVVTNGSYTVGWVATGAALLVGAALLPAAERMIATAASRHAVAKATADV